jgi:alkanesulfonate monooxygenase SsuD/methylene tetrahydromethanopterin reductase-like flavin-dependent oxidoreductase (luciferase family)
MNKPIKQIHLAAHFPGVNNTTVWSDPAAGSHIEFSSFAQFAQTAERGKFDFLFLAEGLRLREQNGQIYDLDVVGRPDTFTVLAALAAVTERLGLTGTINSTFNEPYEVARQFASLDHLSGGRAAWNVVTSWDAFTGENFRRGGFLAQGQRYERAKTFLQTAHELFDSWRGDEIVADKATGVFLSNPNAGAFAHRDAHFDISGRFNVPRSPQGRPVIFQAGDSDEGRDFAAAAADAIFSAHSTLCRASVLHRRQGPSRPLWAPSRRVAHPAGRDIRDRRLRRRGRRDRTRGAARAGVAADSDQVSRTTLEPRPVRPRPGRATAQC